MLQNWEKNIRTVIIRNADFVILRLIKLLIHSLIKKLLMTFRLGVTYNEIKEKKYSLAAGQYFDVKSNILNCRRTSLMLV